MRKKISIFSWLRLSRIAEKQQKQNTKFKMTQNEMFLTQIYGL